MLFSVWHVNVPLFPLSYLQRLHEENEKLFDRLTEKTNLVGSPQVLITLIFSVLKDLLLYFHCTNIPQSGWFFAFIPSLLLFSSFFASFCVLSLLAYEMLLNWYFASELLLFAHELFFWRHSKWFFQTLEHFIVELFCCSFFSVFTEE